MNGNYTIRTISRDELDTVIEWAASEGWNPGLYDADAFYATDPSGFFMGFLGDEPIASISAVSYGDFGFLGLYIVKPEHRGKGYGIQVWKRAIEYLKNHNIGLDGVVAQQENYKKSGFILDYRNIRYEGKSRKSNKKHSDIVVLSKIPFEELHAYDRRLFPASRLSFLEAWVTQPKSTSFGILQHGRLAGYGMIRKCRTGYKIGPLFADNAKLADKLFSVLSNAIKPDTQIFLDVPEVNKAAVALAKRYGMKPMFETARMYTKKQPDIDLRKVFGVTTFELG